MKAAKEVAKILKKLETRVDKKTRRLMELAMKQGFLIGMAEGEKKDAEDK